MPEPDSQHLAVFLSFSGAGGVERMVMNLVREFARRGIAVDLLTVRGESAHLRDVPDNVRHIPLKARHSMTSVRELAAYLRRERPAAMLVAKDRAGRAALAARRFSGVDTRIVVRLGTNLAAALEGRPWLQRQARLLPMRLAYRSVDRIVAVSRGVAEDAHRTTRVPEERIEVIRNPVITPELEELAQQDPGHPWLGQPDTPVILGAGRLTRQKDFPTLLRAFARVRRSRPCRLLILGEGKMRTGLEALARELDVAEDVDLPGFTDNPYAYMARADLFVLSSLWEGSPNVLTEAMALGTPVAATDCPSGPMETLDGGRFGPLVPMGDVPALATGIEQALDRPLPADTLQSAVAEYHVENSADHYLEVLGLR